MSELDIVNVAATIMTIVLLFSPLPDYRRIQSQKCTGEVRVLPVCMLGVTCYTWAIYGYLSGIYFPIMSINVFGTLTSLGFSLVYYRWSSDRSTLHKMGALVGLWILITLLVIGLCKTNVIPLSLYFQKKIIGFAAVFINIFLYASPMKTIKIVLRTKSAASLPVTMCCVNLVTGSLWMLFGILTNDMFVVIPNALGVMLSAIQVLLCVRFRHLEIVIAAHDITVMEVKSEALL
ncbi:3-like protein [Plasmopara halstedii]|uniref:Sugar transporter SWEET1 n=1 Tax=Plasmopara halstedii TaxID=4781 RepID=A0A0P1AJB3_PLAHL|nr:3-like protein [Plasmopara halstedii]CEG40634.1 3-like protein [Plasmopara halstedii]|eukprot:XP_024577003.1 3-like protein [Plasmopara halstedii]